MFRFIIYFLILFFVIRFLFRFLLPVLNITKSASERLRNMQQQMNDMQEKQKNPTPKIPKPGDYIEYEEVK